MHAAVEKLITHALADGFPADKESPRIAHKYDVWRLELINDPPARVPPLKIRLKDGARPYKCKPRKYPPHLRAFLAEFNSRLVDLGWAVENPGSCWACPALPAKKPGTVDGYRQTVDYRPVNDLTEVLAACDAILPVVLENMKKKSHFGIFDFIHGFCQLPPAEKCQELMAT